jgi:hypothetical protein
MSREATAQPQPSAVRLWPIMKIAAMLTGAFMLASGFDWKTPKQKFTEQDTRIAALESIVGVTSNDVGTLLALRCVDNDITPRDRELVALDCADVLRRRRAAASDHTRAAMQAGAPQR